MKKQLSFRFLIFLYFLFQISYSHSQTPVFKKHSPLKSEKNLEVNYFLQDQNGYLWLATSKGLIEYNGVSFQQHLSTDSLFDAMITAICIDSSKTFWIGHANGSVSLFKGKKFSKFEPDEGTPAKKITDIKIDRQGTVWFGTYGEGIYFYKENRMYMISADEGLSDNVVYTLCLTKDGNVWAGTDGGITIINPNEADKEKRLTKLSTKDGLPDNIVKSIVQDEKGNLWIGMQEAGFCKYDFSNKKFETNILQGGWNFGSVNDLLLDKFENLWLATDENGLIKFSLKNNHIRKFSTQHGLSADKIFSLFSDRENNIWLGTNNGLTQYAGDRFEFITQQDGLLSNNVYTFLKDKKGNYWIGTELGLTKFSFDNTGEIEKKHLNKSNGLSHNHIVSLYEDKDGNIFAGTYGGGVCKLNLDNNSVKIYTEKNGLANDNIMSINSDKNGNIWFATLGGGVSKLNPNGDFQNYNSTNGLGSDYVYFVFCDSKNNMWFATDGGGVTKFDGNEFKIFSKNEGLNNETVFTVAEDEKGNMWFSTSGGGIAKYDGNKFEFYTSQNGLRDDAPAVLVNDENGNIIVAHKSGIDKFNFSENKFSYYGTEEGLTFFEPNINAFYFDSEGILWLGTSSGIVKYNPSDKIINTAEPITQITRFRVLTNDISYGKNSSIEFSHDENNVTFDYLAVSLTNPQKVRYKYKLENFDKDWSEETELTSKNYPYLPHGNYKFLVIACNNEGVWNKEPMVQEIFIIKPPFWLTWWFWTLLIVTIGSISYFYTQWRLKKIEAEKKILEDKVIERTAEVVKQKEIIEQKNKDITDSINYAKRIQEAILPSENLIYKHFPESFVIFRPKDIVSGDFFWMSIAKNNSLFISAADCTGHGVPGAFMSMIGYTTLNQMVKEKGLTKPGEILTQMSEAIRLSLRQDEEDSQTRDGMDVALCCVDFGKNEFHYAGAYRPLWIVKKMNGVGKFNLEEIKGDKFPVAGLHIIQERIFTNHTFKINKGETIYIFSDGYADQFGGPEKRKFMTKRFKELLLSIQDKKMQEQRQILIDAVEDWKGNLEQMDDILVIGIRF